MINLGVATKILGRAGLRVRDGRRAENSPHLSVSLLLLRDVLLYLAAQRITCYRLASDLAPYVSHPDYPQFHGQIASCGALLADVGDLARTHAIRLTMHLDLHTTLSTPDDALAQRASNDIIARAALLDALDTGSNSIMVLHVGGAYDDQAAALHRFTTRFERLPQWVRCRIAIEPDEHSFGLLELLPLHQMIGVPIVFDTLHFQLNNRHGVALAEALGLALATWPISIRPKVHFSTQRTEAHLQKGRAGATARVIPPRHGQHADFISPFEFAAFLNAARGLPAFDVMLEAKAADLALLRLREDLQLFAPELAVRVGGVGVKG
ncbi:MAG: UV damage repair endonuclease [Chloroflexi bacterium AL-W]|nr:UV damage repair endonuclease [Chloroflexi bacterium AL-N1]NOK66299.1 UV damage repair endonuclease [Chloroflexi bacterium AL-N10]NOK73179.1 UV damage repair endonuclease [Chloroflexi bacterium AL-N5]NOK80076.1 UV damage repair endonuclease [Chloroflexi bacterium AL-W]NOK88069.1 UV damage repair endonuclease [Chloroflexi bacterium AL-N15]